MIEDVFYNALAAEAAATVSAVCDMPKHRFSAGYKRRKRALIKAYRRSQKNHTELSYTPPRVHTKLKYLWLAIILACVLVLTGFVFMYFSDGFKGKVYHDHTNLFAVNTEGCPTSIEKVYELSVLPEEYKLCDTNKGYSVAEKVYKNNAGEKIIIRQFVKSEFNIALNTEGYEIVETKVNWHDAIYIDFNTKGKVGALVIWDSKDYILELCADLSLEEVLNMARDIDSEVSANIISE
ncbi:MAG: DUF4367 domain-containing protein [Ruminiclostridium sp.]|nr:DUF4367 domain-containing protein [Ruminiclostridium sp.]MBP3854058.1 DUF4367 domain-containing protein [Ruminiclostridium sp.]